MDLTKEHSSDRIFVLSQKEGVKPSDSLGLVDPRLFKGGNKLHAVMDPSSCHWFMKYENGAIPEALKGRFTSFPKLFEVACTYFDKRGVDVKEVQEA